MRATCSIARNRLVSVGEMEFGNVSRISIETPLSSMAWRTRSVKSLQLEPGKSLASMWALARAGSTLVRELPWRTVMVKVSCTSAR